MLCGVTATLGSNPSATATAARPQWGRAVLLCRRGVRGLLVTPLVGRAALCARGRRPAREPSAPRASLGASPRSPARPRHRPSISHVIPLRLVQTLNLHRWNCNVFGVSQKMTTINYVRNLGGGSVVAARRHRSQAPPSPTGTAADPSGVLHTGGAWCADVWLGALSRSPAGSRALTCSLSSVSHAIPPQLFQTVNLQRWNCNVFRHY